MDVNQTYELMKYIVAKNTAQGYLSPDDFYTVINQAQRSYVDYLLGEYQRYREKRPIAVVQMGQNEKIRESLAPLIYNIILNIDASSGISPFPNDFQDVDAMWSVYGYYNIRFVQQSQQDSFYHSQIDPVPQNPIYLIQHEGFHFFPETLGQARMSYVRNAPSIVWGYVTDSNGLPVYNPATSQQPIWSEFDMLNIISRALQMVGVNLQFGAVLQYSNEVKNIGQ